MEDKLLRQFKSGLEEEICSYESMLRISLDEKKVLIKGGYSHELVSLASERLRLMNRIMQVSVVVSPLKAIWLMNREKEDSTRDRDEIEPLVNQLEKVLEELFSVDSENAKKFAELTGKQPLLDSEHTTESTTGEKK